MEQDEELLRRKQSCFLPSHRLYGPQKSVLAVPAVSCAICTLGLGSPQFVRLLRGPQRVRPGVFNVSRKEGRCTKALSNGSIPRRDTASSSAPTAARM